jgi:Flp pilus assembly CpaF family ATPase
LRQVIDFAGVRPFGEAQDLPYRAIKTNVGDSVNVVVHLERRPGRRFISEVVEIHGYDPDRDEYNCGFIFDCQKELV